MSELRDVPVTELYPHPDNPRLQLREDVVEQIAAQIARDGFRREHALLVRPYNGGYQIVSGHQRAEAVRRVGLLAVPAWVRDMTDDEAFMDLVLANAQGELSPLEIGIHAFKAVPLAQGSRSGGGLAEYADRAGYGEDSLRQWRIAAEVYSSLPDTCREVEDKTRHLYEISKAPNSVWKTLVDYLVQREWSVKETAQNVERVRAIDIPERHAGWLPLGEVVERHLEAPDRFTARGIDRLVAAVDEVAAWIDANSDPNTAEEFQTWLAANRGGASWDHRAVVAYHQRLLAQRWEVTGWHHGNWRDHLAELDDASVSLVLTDPPYGMGYQSGYRTEIHEKIASDASVGDATTETTTALEALAPKLTDDAHLLVFCTWRNEADLRASIEAAGFAVRSSIVWVKNNTSMGNLDGTFAPKHERIVHAVKGNPKLYRRAPDVIECPRESSERHPTEKPVKLLAELIEATTAAGQIVADPFAGVASACVAAKELGRKWWACELNESYWRVGEERLS